MRPLDLMQVDDVYEARHKSQADQGPNARVGYISPNNASLGHQDIHVEIE